MIEHKQYKQLTHLPIKTIVSYKYFLFLLKTPCWRNKSLSSVVINSPNLYHLYPSHNTQILYLQISLTLTFFNSVSPVQSKREYELQMDI